MRPSFVLRREKTEEEMKMTTLGFGLVSAAVTASFAVGMMVQAARS